MFYAHFVLSKKGPLARIWLAAHWDKKLTKAHVFETNIEGSVEAIIQPKMKLALRTSGHLLLGVVRIYSRKAKYLLADCNEAFVKIKMAFRPGAVDLPEENREAAMAAITLPEDFHEFDTAMADLSDIDVHAQFAVNQSRPEEITMREDLGNITLVGDDGFGDMGFDGGSGMMQDAHLDDSLYKSADGACCFLLDGGRAGVDEHTVNDDVGFDTVDTQHEDGYTSPADDYEGPACANDDDDDDDDDDDGERFGAVDHELFGDTAFTAEPGGLFEEPAALTPAITTTTTTTVGVDSLQLQKNDMFMSPSRTPRYALSDITPQQNLVIDQYLTNSQNTVDQSTLLTDETEAFALEPIDITAIGTERKVRKKRRLIIDEMKSIASETMKLQLSDTSEIVSTLDLAPPTKKLMHWKETGGVEKLFAFPGKQIVSRKLSKLFSTNLVTRSSTVEHTTEQLNVDVDRQSVCTDIEQQRLVANGQQLDVSEMPELAPAVQDAYHMPASVAPCLTDDTDASLRVSFTPSGRVSSLTSPASHRDVLSSPSHRRTPAHLPHMSPVKSPSTVAPAAQLLPTLAPYGGSDDENDEDAGYDLPDNDDDDDDDEQRFHDTELSASRTTAVAAAAADDVDCDMSSEPEDETTLLEPVDEAEVEEGKEAEAEERRWNKRSQQMLVALNRCLQRHDSVTFRQMAPPSANHSRKQAAAKFYTFLVLKKNEAVEVSQCTPYGDIAISRGLKFHVFA